jgi:chorismate-pyruvate lyase
MTSISVIIGTKRNILCGFFELERKINTKITLPFKILLLAATGTIESTLSILTNSETEIKILKQKDNCNIIKRTVSITQKRTGVVMVRADSSVYTWNLPYGVIQKIRKKDQSIGKIITAYQLETFRSIHSIGYNPANKCFFRIYKIMYNRNIAFVIKEVFLSSLNKEIKIIHENI